MKVYITARLVAYPDKTEQLEENIKKAAPLVRKEKGCIQYDFLRSIKEPHVFLFSEIWESQEALQEHIKTPILAEMQAANKTLCPQPAQVEMWEAVNIG